MCVGVFCNTISQIKWLYSDLCRADLRLPIYGKWDIYGCVNDVLVRWHWASCRLNMQRNTIKVESTNAPIISIFKWVKLTGILKLGIKTMSITSEATTKHQNLSFHSISQKQATRFPNWKIVSIFYTSTININISVFSNNSTFAVKFSGDSQYKTLAKTSVIPSLTSFSSLRQQNRKNCSWIRNWLADNPRAPYQHRHYTQYNVTTQHFCCVWLTATS